MVSIFPIANMNSTYLTQKNTIERNKIPFRAKPIPAAKGGLKRSIHNFFSKIMTAIKEACNAPFKEELRWWEKMLEDTETNSLIKQASRQKDGSELVTEYVQIGSLSLPSRCFKHEKMPDAVLHLN